MQWTNDLSAGVEQIDSQHKELIARINTLLDAMKQGRGRAEVGQTMSFLGDYVVSHFGEEEKYMSSFCYPEIDGHKAAHKAFVSDFRQLTKGINNGEANSLTAIQVQHHVCDWLVNHICKTDKALGSYLKSRL